MQTPETPQRWEERRKQKKAENPNLGDLHLPLEVAVQMWPTPQAADARGPGPQPEKGSPPLAAQVKRETWATPAARDWRDGKSNQHDKNSRPLNEQIVGPGHGDQTRPTTLNPAWVSLLMGYPLWWVEVE